MDKLFECELTERCYICNDESNKFRDIEMVEIEIYLNLLDNRISDNIKLYYNLPNDLWHLQQTNGYRSFKKGINFITSNPY